MNTVKRFLANEDGATAIEYALIAAGIAVVIVPTVGLLGATIKAKFQAVVTALG